MSLFEVGRRSTWIAIEHTCIIPKNPPDSTIMRRIDSICVFLLRIETKLIELWYILTKHSNQISHFVGTGVGAHHAR